MSVLELTLSYTRLANYGEFETPILTYRQKRTVTVVGFSLFIILIVIYLYVMGSIVSKNYERNKLSLQLERASSRAEGAEQQMLKIHSIYTADYFTEQGYIKPTTLGIIKKASDVAEAHISYFY